MYIFECVYMCCVVIIFSYVYEVYCFTPVLTCACSTGKNTPSLVMFFHNCLCMKAIGVICDKNFLFLFFEFMSHKKR